MKKAIITGVTGQDGSYLAELLLNKGYEVVGVTSGKSNTRFIDSIKDRLELVVGDISNREFITELIQKHTPDEIYNLASVSNVIKPWENVLEIIHTAALTPIYILEAITLHSSATRYFQASSSEMYGKKELGPQDEITSFNPINPYGISKLLAHNFIQSMREEKHIFAVSGILFNHESPRRGDNFLTKKVVRELCNIKKGISESFSIGNMDAARDWGYARDYVEAMWLMLQQDTPEDFVIATGERHTVREFIEKASHKLGIHISWQGEGLQEIGVDENGKTILTIEEKFYRKNDNTAIFGNTRKAENVLHWKATTNFQSLVDLMVDAEYDSEI